MRMPGREYGRSIFGWLVGSAVFSISKRLGCRIGSTFGRFDALDSRLEKANTNIVWVETNPCFHTSNIESKEEGEVR
jgi:hypothetical protein